MKSKSEMVNLANAPSKVMEKELGIKIRNGQARKAIKETLNWVLQ